MKKTIIFFLLACTLSATSCLDKLPKDSIPEDEAMQSLSDAEQTMTGIYATLKSSALFSGALTLAPDLQTDLAYAVEGNTNVYGDIWNWNILATNSDVENVYAALYAVIGRCNFLLENADRVEATLSSQDDFDALDVYRGEAHFARALAYSELIKLFCKAYDPATAENELGVVLSTSYSKKAQAKRASLKASYELVLEDLKAAEDLIEYDTYNATYFTIGTVHSLFARVYLYMQNWDEAIAHATEVISNKVYSLANATTSISSTQSYFQYMWTDDSAYEVIWKVGFTVTSYGGALGTVFQNYDYTSYKPDYVPATSALNLYSNSDLRYNAYFKSTTTGYSHGLTWPMLIKYPGNTTFLKNYILGVNMPKVFRLAEQYLIRAEAYCEKGQYSQGAADITKLCMARYSSYGSTSLSEDSWRSTIEEEREKELYMEGFRLQDLKRWGLGFTRKSQDFTSAPGNTLKISADNPMFVWPIPQHELEAPGSEIQPNESNK
ncbi:MAG: RagB/SusD family nutrient uptake outer membrane protein [Bacteroidales bacterium]